MGYAFKQERGSGQTAFAALLAAGMLAALLALAGLTAPAPAYAAESLQGSGTADDPTLIYTADDFVAWGKSMRAMPLDEQRQQHAKLMGDFDITDADLDAMNYSDLQTAELDGNGRIINLDLSRHGGLFENGGIPSADKDDDETFTSVHHLSFQGSVSAPDGKDAGALFSGISSDKAHPRSVRVEDCANWASVSGENAGGLVGSFRMNGSEWQYSMVRCCSNYGSVTGAQNSPDSSVGGILGLLDNGTERVSRTYMDYWTYGCSNGGAVHAGAGYAGGIIGAISGWTGDDLSACFNVGSVASDQSKAAGICGLINVPAGGSADRRVWDHCYSSGPISSPVGAQGMLAEVVYPNAQINKFTEVIGFSYCYTLETSIPQEYWDNPGDGTLYDRDEWNVLLDWKLNMDALSDGYMLFINDVVPTSPFYGSPVLDGVTDGATVDVQWIDGLGKAAVHKTCWWNTVPSKQAAPDAPDGYRFAYWTRDAPNEYGLFEEPPTRYMFDEGDLTEHLRADASFYAYFVPNTLTVTFDVNKPQDAAGTFALNPSDARKTLKMGEALGTAPTATWTKPASVENLFGLLGDSNPQWPEETDYQFIGWNTSPDGTGAWVDENTTDFGVSVSEADAQTVLYAQWQQYGYRLYVTEQPVDQELSAVEGSSRDVTFKARPYRNGKLDGTYNTLWYQWQRAPRGTQDFADIDGAGGLLKTGTAGAEYSFTAERDDLGYVYRCKFDSHYDDAAEPPYTVYSNSASVTMSLPQSNAQVTEVTYLEEQDTKFPTSGKKTYNIHVSLAPYLKLIGEDMESATHKLWIEEAPNAATTTEPGELEVTMYEEVLTEGATYTLCVKRVFADGSYDNAGDVLRVPFTVPFESVKPLTDHHVLLVADNPLPEDPNDTAWPYINSSKQIDDPVEAEIGDTVYLVYDATWPMSLQDAQRQLEMEWKYADKQKDSWGRYEYVWEDLPEKYFTTHKNNDQPTPDVTRWRQNSDGTWSSRTVRALVADGGLDIHWFGCDISMPPSSTKTVVRQPSNFVYNYLDVLTPAPKLTSAQQIDVQQDSKDALDNGLGIEVEWDWQAGDRVLVPDSITVDLRKMNDDGSWGDWATGITVDDPMQLQAKKAVAITMGDEPLQPHTTYQVSVKATVGDDATRCDKTEYKEVQLQGTAGSIISPKAIEVAPDEEAQVWAEFEYENKDDFIVRYSWQLSTDLDGRTFARTYNELSEEEGATITYPTDFGGEHSDKKIRIPDSVDPGKAFWIRYVAMVYYKNADGSIGSLHEQVPSSAVPIISVTSAPTLHVDWNEGAHDAYLTWDAPESGNVAGYHLNIFEEDDYYHQEPHKILTFPSTQTSMHVTGLKANTQYAVVLSTYDPRFDKKITASDRGAFLTGSTPVADTWELSGPEDAVTVGGQIELNAVRTDQGRGSKTLPCRWLSRAIGEEKWKEEGTDDSALSHISFSRTATADDIGRQWKLESKRTSNTDDASSTAYSNVVTPAVIPTAVDGVTVAGLASNAVTLSWNASAGADGYVLRYGEGASGGPAVPTSALLREGDYTVTDDVVTYTLGGLSPATNYTLCVAATALGNTTGFTEWQPIRTESEPLDLAQPVITRQPASTLTDLGSSASFTAQAAVDGAADNFVLKWQRKGLGESAFVDIDATDSRYTVTSGDVQGGTGEKYSTLAIASLTKEDAVAAFRCVATNSRAADATVARSAESAAVHAFVSTPEPKNVSAQATGTTTAKVTWTPGEIVRRYTVSYVPEALKDNASAWQVKPVELAAGDTDAACDLDGLAPNTKYYVEVKATPQVGFDSPAASATFTTRKASSLTEAKVTPGKSVVNAGDSATFNVETNAGAGETLAYRWQARDIGGDWADLPAAQQPNAAELTVQTDEGTPVATGYRCVVTAQTADGASASVESAPGLLWTRVDVVEPANLAAEATSSEQATFSWEAADLRRATYDVEYALRGTAPDSADGWTRVENVGSATSCTARGLAPNTAYIWRVRAVVNADGGLVSDWVQGAEFATPAKPSQLETVTVTPRVTAAVAGSGQQVALSATTNVDGREALAYRWERFDAATGEWVPGGGDGWNEQTYHARITDDTPPGGAAFRCVVSSVADNGDPLATVVSDRAVVAVVPTAPVELAASDVTVEGAALSWTWDGPDDVAAVSYNLAYRTLDGGDGDEWTAVEGLESPAYALRGLQANTAYEWRVQAVQNRAKSAWSPTGAFITMSPQPTPVLTRVVVGPLDQTPMAGQQAKLTAYTNLPNDAPGSLTYTWETRGLDSAEWTPVSGATGREVVLSADTSGYVRCTVSYAPAEGSQPTERTSNEARVLVKPSEPYGLTANVRREAGAVLSWSDDTSNSAGYEAAYREIGTDTWNVNVVAGKQWTVSDLKQGTSFEWRVRALSAADDVASEWVDGPVFTTEMQPASLTRVDASPRQTAALAGAQRTVTFTAVTDADGATASTLSYQWQSYGSGRWNDVADATGKTYEVAVASKPTGAHAYRCVVTEAAADGTPLAIVESGAATLTVAPHAPHDLAATDVTTTGATVSWQWTETGVSALGAVSASAFASDPLVGFAPSSSPAVLEAAAPAAAYTVAYREVGAEEWSTQDVSGAVVDSATCVLSDLTADTPYEWRVRAQVNGMDSPWSAVGVFVTLSTVDPDAPDPVLNRAVAGPLDQTMAPGEKATLGVVTNLGIEAQGLSYAWQLRALDSDPDDASAWSPVGGNGNKVELDAGASGYVRCMVTHVAADGSETKATSNEARVRLEPAAPTGLSVTSVGDDAAELVWNDSKPAGGTYTLAYSVLGSDTWTELPLLEEAAAALSDLAPNTAYQWRVRVVAEEDLASTWTDGPRFATTAQPSALTDASIAPTAPFAIAGRGRTVEFTAATNVDGSPDEALAFQWQVLHADGVTWVDLDGETDRTLRVTADENRQAGAYRFCCAVTSTRASGKQASAVSNEATLSLLPQRADDLATVDVGADTATLAWSWAGPGAADSFSVEYRVVPEGAWEPAPEGSVDAERLSCTLDGLLPETGYEWRVQAVQNGLKSAWSEAGGFATLSDDAVPSLKSVLAAPLDQTVAAGQTAAVTAYTNLGDIAALTYRWEQRPFDSGEDAWEVIDDATGRSVDVALEPGESRLVRCMATYSPAGVDPTTKTSNQARVRVQPVVPDDLVASAGEPDSSAVSLAWSGVLPVGGSFELSYKADGDAEWTTVSGIGQPAYLLEGLDPDTVYEWRVRAVAADGLLASEWADGFAFRTAPRTYVLTSVEVSSAYQEVDPGEQAELTAATNLDDVDAAGFTLSYVWEQRAFGSGDDAWKPVPNTAARTVKLPSGTDGYVRCTVTQTLGDGATHEKTGNVASVRVRPAAPANLAVGSIGTAEAMLSWSGALPAGGSFELLYKKVRDAEWTSVTDLVEAAYTVRGLESGATYAWRVRAVAADGVASAWTDGPAFTTQAGPTPNPPSPTPPDPTPTPLPDGGGKALAPTGDPLTVALPLAGMLAAACAAAIALAAMRLRKRR